MRRKVRTAIPRGEPQPARRAVKDVLGGGALESRKEKKNGARIPIKKRRGLWKGLKKSPCPVQGMTANQSKGGVVARAMRIGKLWRDPGGKVREHVEWSREKSQNGKDEQPSERFARGGKTDYRTSPKERATANGTRKNGEGAEDEVIFSYQKNFKGAEERRSTKRK